MAGAKQVVAAESPVPVEFKSLPIEMIEPSGRNPRRHFDQAALEQLALSISQKGIIEPIVVRPMSDDDGAFYEIVAGERRYRAAKIAKLTHVPSLVHQIDDLQALELAIIENNQRVDVHPIEEAQGFEALRAMDGAYDPHAIAQKIGRSESYVRGRLRLLKLTPLVREAFEANAITAAHAEVLTRVPADMQQAALENCFSSMFGFDMEGVVQETAEESRMDDAALLIARRKWSVLHTGLVPVGDIERWAEQRKKTDINGDPEARQAVLEALGEDEAEPSGPDPVASLLQLSAAPWPNRDLGVIGSHYWKPIKGKNRCPHAAKGVIVHGSKPGPVKVLDVCATTSCALHFPQAAKPTSTSGSSGASSMNTWQEKERKRQQKEAVERKAWDALKPKAFSALVAHMTALKSLAVNAAFVKHVLQNPYELSRASRVEADFKITLSDKTAVLVLALSVVAIGDRASFLRTTKPYKFDLAKVEAAHKAETKAAAKPAAKKEPTKKPAAKKPAAKKEPTKKPAAKKPAAKKAAKGKKR